MTNTVFQLKLKNMSTESTPNLAHVVPDVKKTLKGDDLLQFFQKDVPTPIPIKTYNFSSPPNTLFPANDLEMDRSIRMASMEKRQKPKFTSMKPDGFDAAYIDNVLSPGTFPIFLCLQYSTVFYPTGVLFIILWIFPFCRGV